MKKILLLAITVGCFCSFDRQETTWVAIGDSITYLNDHLDETGNRVTKGYMTRVTEKVPGLHYVNQGHNGWTAVRIATEIETLGIPKGDVYSVFLGTNDWWGSKPLGAMSDYTNNTGVGTVYGAFRAIINKIKSLNPYAKIILITPMQRVDFVYIANFKNNAYGSYKDKAGQSLSQFADAVIAIGKQENIPVVDLFNKSGMNYPTLVKYKRLKDPETKAYKNYPYPDFIGIPFTPETDEYPYPPEAGDMTYDGLHPSDKGYTVITNMLLPFFKK